MKIIFVIFFSSAIPVFSALPSLGVNSLNSWVISPVATQIFQRSGSTGTIIITGETCGVHIIEASFNGGAFQTIATNPYGRFTGSLTGQTTGYGALIVRWVDDTNHYAQVQCGIGDIFVVAGQSNGSGRGSNSQSYNSPNGILVASEFSNAYTWINLADPTDSPTSQVNVVSSDTSPAAAGSIWPLVASYILTNNSAPVAFVPCAKGGVSITSWLPGGLSHSEPGTLYGSMVARAKDAFPGGVKAVLLWEGETDAGNSMSQATYYDNLTNFTANVMADLGVKVISCKLQNCSGLTGPQQTAINDAIAQTWSGGDANSFTGPDLTGLNTTPEDTLHLKTDAKLASAANLWWLAIKSAFSW